MAYSGWANVSTAVVAFGAVALVGSGVGPGAPDASEVFFISRLKVNATSAAVIGLPSLNFTPGRMVNVSVLPPLDQAYSEASHGTGAGGRLHQVELEQRLIGERLHFSSGAQ